MGAIPLKFMIIDDNARFRALLRSIVSTQSDEFPKARVIILSNHTNQRMILKGLEFGAKAYLPKEDIFAVQKFIRPPNAGEYHAATTHYQKIIIEQHHEAATYPDHALGDN